MPRLAHISVFTLPELEARDKDFHSAALHIKLDIVIEKILQKNKINKLEFVDHSDYYQYR